MFSIEMSDRPIEMSPTRTRCRPRSILSWDIYNQLYLAYRSKDLDAFENHLRRRHVDPDNWYDEPTFATLLDLASKDPGREEFVKALLKAEADPNRINPVRKKAPIHLAAESANCEALEALLEDPRTDVNRKDNTGSTALHLAAREDGASKATTREQVYRYQKCIQILLERQDIEVNEPNRKGLTAVHVAALYATPETLQHILVRGGSRLDVDSFEDTSGQTARQVIVERHPSLVRLLHPASSADAPIDQTRLFYHLYCGEDAAFTQKLEKYVGSLDANDGSHTFLQLACEKGLIDSVGALLDGGANPNLPTSTERRFPLHLAAFRGYYRIVRRLLASGVDPGTTHGQDTALHAAVKGAGETALPLGASVIARDYYKTVKELLKEDLSGTTDVNATDLKGNTALHYAVRLGDQEMVLTLLRAGAYIGVRNRLGEPPLADISPKTLEAYLDECVDDNKLLPREDNYEIVLKYGFLAPRGVPTTKQQPPPEVEQTRLKPRSSRQLLPVPETDPLLYMSRSADLRHLLKHPIITSFLQLKWHLIRACFFINLVFYVFFWTLLTAYILSGYSKESEQPTEIQIQTGRNSSSPDAGRSHHGAHTIVALLGLFTILLAIRELFQLFLSPRKYIKSPENWMEFSLIIITFVLLFSRQTDGYARQQLSAVAILFSWAELVLLIGRHPVLATNIEMFKTVSYNFLQFLAWYSILIVAFALSFYTLFRDCPSSVCKTDDGENFFVDPGMSVFKTVVMLTGEFDAGSIPFVSYPGTSHILFVLFVFLIAIVLFNLLNGLAVSDTQAIREDAELVAYISRVKLIAYIETMLMGDAAVGKGVVNRVRRVCCCVRTYSYTGIMTTMSNKINLFPHNVPDGQIHVLPNQCNRIEFENTLDCKRTGGLREDDDDVCQCCGRRGGSCQTVTLDKSIMRAIKMLFAKKEQDKERARLQELNKSSQGQIEKYLKDMEEYRKKFDDYFQSNQRTEEALSAILEKLNN